MEKSIRIILEINMSNKIYLTIVFMLASLSVLAYRTDKKIYAFQDEVQTNKFRLPEDRIISRIVDKKEFLANTEYITNGLTHLYDAQYFITRFYPTYPIRDTSFWMKANYSRWDDLVSTNNLRLYGSAYFRAWNVNNTLSQYQLLCRYLGYAKGVKIPESDCQTIEICFMPSIGHPQIINETTAYQQSLFGNYYHIYVANGLSNIDRFKSAFNAKMSQTMMKHCIGIMMYGTGNLNALTYRSMSDNFIEETTYGYSILSMLSKYYSESYLIPETENYIDIPAYGGSFLGTVGSDPSKKDPPRSTPFSFSNIDGTNYTTVIRDPYIMTISHFMPENGCSYPWGSNETYSVMKMNYTSPHTLIEGSTYIPSTNTSMFSVNNVYNYDLTYTNVVPGMTYPPIDEYVYTIGEKEIGPTRPCESFTVNAVENGFLCKPDDWTKPFLNWRYTIDFIYGQPCGTGSAKYMSIRTYNRKLTDEEIRYNMEVDIRRFGDNAF